MPQPETPQVPQIPARPSRTRVTEIILDGSILAWKFDARPVTPPNVEDWDDHLDDPSWIHAYEDGWNRGIEDLYRSGLRPKEQPYRWDEPPGGGPAVSYYELELIDPNWSGDE